LAKHANSAKADERLKKVLSIDPIPDFPDDPPFYEYPNEFDHLGGDRGRARYIAVVHVDGNSLGKRINAYIEKAENNREMVQRMRVFSKEVNRAGLSAIKQIRDWLLKELMWTYPPPEDRLVDRWQKENYIHLEQDRYLPMRPIVYGGDDVTLVCEGRLGLPIAAELIKAFGKIELPDEKPIYACAGVAIVHSHYPFARAYALSEELCHKAKKAALNFDEEKKLGMLHWYYASAGRTLENWHEIHSLEYEEEDGSMTMRPLEVIHSNSVSSPAFETWDVFVSQIEAFRTGSWSGKRNKIKELRTALRAGPTAVRKFTSLHGTLPQIKTLPGSDYCQTGWQTQKCLYFDAIEANDLFIYPKK
jgi:hypothetical protein